MIKFIMPKESKNYEGELRRVGFELEFSNINIEKILEILQNTLPLKVDKKNNFLYKLDSSYGEFTLELDFELLTKQRLRSDIKDFFGGFGFEVREENLSKIEEIVGELSRDIVPYEISTPPLPLDEMEMVDKIVKGLNQNSAFGTKDRFYNAFGLHINIEAISLEVDSILSYLKAYMILQDYINLDANIDIARKISPFINNFEKDYIKHILRAKYKPTMQELIDDYIEFNPTRNRSLDMLPMLAFIDENRVRSVLKGEKIKPRPTFHYRLSNSNIGDKNWRVATEWNRWIVVEELANDVSALDRLSEEYLEYLDRFIKLEKWESKVAQWLKR